MRLDQVRTAPQPYDPARGAEARALFSGLPKGLLDLIEGVAGSSAYLNASILKETDWLTSIANAPLDTSFNALLHFNATTFNALSDQLRIAKRRGALLIALADIGGLWTLNQVTDAITRLAEAAVNSGLQFLVEAEATRGKLAADPAEAAGMFALAMGKMGAYELNYSSDIDLIILFDEARHPPENWGELRAAFIRITKRLIKLLSENTAEGYVFRTDLRLRPDASVTPVCIATEPAERYYESLGRTWERAAFIKARACAGAIQAGEAFLARLEPFVWRRHLDFAAIEDAHDMRLRIRAHKGLHGPLKAAGHNMKLGQGGIREIEFFAQTQQLILGGKDRGLRMRGTLAALEALAARGHVPPAVAKALSKAYTAHRTLEHRIQMLDDAQTHVIPESPEKRQQLAMLCGQSLAEFEAETVARLGNVHHIIEAFFNDDTAAKDVAETWNAPERAAQITEGWLSYAALRSDRAQRIFGTLKPQIMASLCKAQNPDEALIQFDNFLKGLPAGVQVFSLFKARPELLDMLIDICTMAPDLARYLGQNPRVLEAVISAEFFKRLPPLPELKDELAGELAHCGDYEQQLDMVRTWAQEQRFRVGVHLLRGIAGADETARAYSNIAEACVAELFSAVVQHFSTRHGPPPGKGAAVIAMGKLGSREMTVSSDLDLIVVYDPDGEAESGGKRPLPVKTYYARFTQALVSALTVSTSKGGLFEVDMRLRPSGRQGPVATSLAAFETYQKSEAWVWEHMALLRSRVVVGPVSGPVRTVITDVLHAPKKAAEVLQALSEMRARLAESKTDRSVWNVKIGAGGLMDVELLLQAGGLIKGAQAGLRAADLAAAGWLTAEETHRVTRALSLYQKVQQVSRLAVQGVFDPAKSGTGAAALLARTCGYESIAALETALDAARHEMANLIENKLADTP